MHTGLFIGLFNRIQFTCDLHEAANQENNKYCDFYRKSNFNAIFCKITTNFVNLTQDESLGLVWTFTLQPKHPNHFPNFHIKINSRRCYTGYIYSYYVVWIKFHISSDFISLTSILKTDILMPNKIGSIGKFKFCKRQFELVFTLKS